MLYTRKCVYKDIHEHLFFHPSGIGPRVKVQSRKQIKEKQNKITAQKAN